MSSRVALCATCGLALAKDPDSISLAPFCSVQCRALDLDSWLSHSYSLVALEDDGNDLLQMPTDGCKMQG